MEGPRLRDELADLIARHLERRSDGAGAAPDLASLASGGVQKGPERFLDRVELAGKTVLDLGSGLGARSRRARGRGASQVDGFEEDPRAVELAAVIDAHARAAHVAHLHRRLGDPASYANSYDVVLAFGVSSALEHVYERLVQITREILVLELPVVGDPLAEQLVEAFGSRLPHYAILGEHEGHAVVALARDEATLLAALVEEPGAPPNVLAAALARRPGFDEPAQLVHVDLTKPPRQALQARFFMMFRFDSLDELLDAIDHMEVDVDSLSRSIEIRNLGSEGWIYWFLFTKGYLQYARAGEIGPGNAYFDYLVRHFIAHGHDPAALPALAEHDLAVERVARRYRDFDALRRLGAERPDPPPGTKPVRITTTDRPRDPPLLLYEAGSEEPLPVKYIDGWHRLCSARLSGFRSYPCEAIPENLHNRPIRGAVERFEFDGERLRAAGWFLDREHLVNFELRHGRPVLARGVPADRPDIAAAFPNIGHARASGFEIDVPCDLSSDVVRRFDLVVMHEIFPVGVIPLVHLPGGGPEIAPGAPAIVYELFRPLVRRRALASIARVADLEGGDVPLRPALERLLPGATVEAHDRPGAIAPGSADLVTAHAVLPSLAPEAQLAFLEQVRAGLRRGGMLAVTVRGELARSFVEEPEILCRLAQDGISAGGPPGASTLQTRDYTVRAYGNVLEVVDYVAGGVAGLHDLVILRKH